MVRVEYGALIEKLNDHVKNAMQAAAGVCMSHTHYDLDVEHLLHKLLDDDAGDVAAILSHYNVDRGRLQKTVDAALGKMKTGNGNVPGLSPRLPRWIQDAWMLGSIHFGSGAVRSGHLLLAMLASDEPPPVYRALADSLGKIRADDLIERFPTLVKDSVEEASTPVLSSPGAGASGAGVTAGGGKTKALDQFTIDLTQQARDGKIDPIVGRDREIRDVVDILIRKRKNNPLLIGEAGVGKTAAVEGLARRIVEGDVPETLRQVRLLTLDLGLLQAGAGVRGEFENRLKNVVKEITSSPQPIILFIDEIHTLMGAGGQQGAGDAANLMKPALARGELRTIGATTRAEHKQFIAKDPALDRRFQTIEVDEPTVETAARMLRSQVSRFESHHGVHILESAIHAAVQLSSRYITGRQLPDKAVDLLDTACARVALAMAATPAELDDTNRTIDHLKIEIGRLEREQRSGEDVDLDDLTELRDQLSAEETKREELEGRWSEEKKQVEEIRGLRERLEELEGDEYEELKAELGEKRRTLEESQGDSPLVNIGVDGQSVAKVVASWTGVPVGKMVRDEMKTLLELKDRLGDRVVGQEHALEIIANRLQTSRYNLENPDQPIGIFLLVGPSGVGKTETALTLSDVLFGGEQNVIAINMTEFKEQHSSARLIGPPPGYAGFGKGGLLTEKVRHRPYSVVLLDEVEKAHPDVREFFQQVFDKGYLADTEGHIANFRNTVLIMTANVGDETIIDHCYAEDEEGALTEKDPPPSPEELVAAIQPELLTKFSSSLLARMTIVPYYPMTEEVLKRIVRLKLKSVGERLASSHKIELEHTDAVVQQIADRCTEVQSGARNINRIISGTVLPTVAQQLLGRLAEGVETAKVRLDVGEDGEFVYELQ